MAARLMEDRWRHVWGWISYDPDTNLIFYGTSNPGPGTPMSGRVTTNGRREFLPVMLTRAKLSGSISTATMIFTTTMA